MEKFIFNSSDYQDACIVQFLEISALKIDLFMKNYYIIIARTCLFGAILGHIWLDCAQCSLERLLHILHSDSVYKVTCNM